MSGDEQQQHCNRGTEDGAVPSTTAGGSGAEDLSCADVTTKYRVASEIANNALKQVVENCTVNASIYELCSLGDKILVEEAAKVYNKKEKGKKVDKGIAFPTCCSVNEICGHFCPLDEKSGGTVKDGDIVKIDLGCHIDGYICVVGHTVVVGKIDTRKSDCVNAAWYAGEAALRLFKVGNKSSQVTQAIEKVAKQFGCQPVAGVMSHQMKRYVIEGSRYVPGLNTPEDKPEEFTFAANEVYGVDIVISTGEGKAKESDIKTTVFRRAVENKYILKSQLGRHFLAEVEQKFPTLPFSLKAMADERAYKVGVSESLRHELLRPFSVYADKSGEFVAQYKFTVLLLPGGKTKKITGIDFHQKAELESVCQRSITDPELKALLATAVTPGKKKKKKSSSEKVGDKKEEEGDLSSR